jgi:predicted 3-demethylubiquinone-9 3-methyltransferase (glyoxalase superfamily)
MSGGAIGLPSGDLVRRKEKSVPIQKITPFLWFDHQAEEAVNFYTSIFPNSAVSKIARYGPAGPGPDGSVMTIEFQLHGQVFVALNGGPHFKFTEAISFLVNCDTQEEVDAYWERLSAGGGEAQCGGWLKDKFGLSWQIVPTVLAKLMSDPDAKKNRARHEGDAVHAKTGHPRAHASLREPLIGAPVSKDIDGRPIAKWFLALGSFTMSTTMMAKPASHPKKPARIATVTHDITTFQTENALVIGSGFLRHRGWRSRKTTTAAGRQSSRPRHPSRCW